jgi:hypothetical protein
MSKPLFVQRGPSTTITWPIGMAQSMDQYIEIKQEYEGKTEIKETKVYEFLESLGFPKVLNNPDFFKNL